ncbi:hypothetical protein JL722_12373 [Aureococcus anophagefferens]|nr:hypothetical protein JL722_12373 [Aureococcus anophagefferens]
MIGVFDPVGMLKKRLEHRELYVRYENMVHPERLICVLLLTVVSFVEIPLWCLERRSDVFAWEDARALCAAPGSAYLSGTDYLPVGATLLAEFACVGFGAPGLPLRAVPPRRAARGERDGDLRVLRGRRRAAARVFNVSALLALCVGISGWLAAITFDDLDFENREGVDVNDGFDSLGTSIYTMFFVSTTANFPDQMLPSFTYRRTFGLFFFIYVLLAVFIFLNLILAVVYNEYSDFVKGRVIEANRNRARGLNEAFKLLADAKGDDGSPQISRDAFEKLVEHTNDVERVPRVEAGEVAFFFSIMDDDKSGAISKAEFYDVCDILQYSFVKVRTTTWLQRNRPDVAASPEYARLEAFVKSPLFPRVSMAVLLLNTAVVFLSSYLDLADTLTPGGEEAFAVVEMLFSIAYAALLAAQLAVEPFDEFWLHTSNRFDATVDRFRLICECVAKIVPAPTGAVGVLFCAGALWSGAGVQLFGGLVYDGNGALEGSDYLDSHYDVLNFNDFAMGFLPLFAMVTSGGPYTEFVEALNDVSGAKGAGYYFFVSFYAQYTEARALAHDDEADTLDQSCVEEGYRIVATRRSAQNDVYRAMFLEDDDGDDDDDDECGVIN